MPPTSTSGEKPDAPPAQSPPSQSPFPPFANDSSAPDDHPLIAFRRFADAQLAALLHGFVGPPSSSAQDERPPPLTLRHLEMEADGEETEQRPRRNRWRGRERGRCMRHHHPHRGNPELQDSESSLRSDPLRSANAAMLTHYLLHDGYSPLALETDPALKRINWRAAFAELVTDNTDDAGTAARPPPDQPPRDWAVTTAQRWARGGQSGSAQAGFFIGFPSLHALHAPWDRGLADAMHGMEHGPSLRNAVREKEREKTRKMESSDAHTPAQPHTELDMYERFLDGVRPADAPRKQKEAATQTESPTLVLVARAEDQKPETPQKAAPQPETPQREPGLIATLTTTEQVVLPDGTTHTKVALKKRFSDGREERKETVHTTHGEEERDWARIEAPLKAAGSNPKTSVTQELAKQKQSKGWFWS